MFMSFTGNGYSLSCIFKASIQRKAKGRTCYKEQPHTDTPVKATDNVSLPTSQMKASAYLRTGFAHTGEESNTDTRTDKSLRDRLTDRERHRNRHIGMQTDADRQTDRGYTYGGGFPSPSVVNL